MNILITGITGFVGSHLAEYLATKTKAKIYGTAVPLIFDKELKKIKRAKSNITLLKCDLTDKESVKKVILECKPDKIFHLAGQSQVFFSFNSPEKTLLNNIVSDLNILEAVRSIKINPIIVFAGSSEEYGEISKKDLPIKETTDLKPLSPYAVSKVTQEKLAFQYFKSYGLKTVLMRFFNICGPRQSEYFVAPTFAKQIAEIEKGDKKPAIYVGNLNAKRDFIDVRDAVRAYWLASQKCNFGEPYNICSGKSRSIESVLNLLLRKSKIKNIQVKQDLNRMRPSDFPNIFGDCSKFRKETGWKPQISFEKTMEDLLNYWRKNLLT